MPKRNKNKKGKSSPKGRGRVTRKTNRAQITRPPGTQFYADAERATIKFTDQYMIVTPTAGVLGNLTYKLNSLFHVNQTAGSGTPQGVASLSAKFKKYLVHNSRIHWRIRGLEPGGSYGSLGVLGIAATTSCLYSATMYPTPSNYVAATSMLGASVQKYASKRFNWPRDIAVPSAAVPEASVVNPRVIWEGSHSMRPQKLDADPDQDNPSYTAAFGTDPAFIQYWIFAFQDILADATAEKVFLAEIEMWFDITCFDRVDVADLLLSAPLSALNLSGAEEKKAPPPKLSEVSALVEPDVSPLSLCSLPNGYELVKRKSLAALGARRS